MKKPIKMLLLLPILISLIFFSFLYSYHFVRIPKAIATDMWAFKFPDKFDYYATIKCGLFDIANPAFVFVDKMPERDLELMFYGVNINGIFSKDIELNYIGGTDVKNTTFPELVKMVKEDCEQFRDGHASDTEGGPEWIYTRAQTTEEKANDIRNGYLGRISLLPPFKEIYGDINEMTDDEVIALNTKIDEDGLDERVELAEKANKIRKELEPLPLEEWDRIEARYGDWYGLSDEELIEWAVKVKADLDSGAFVINQP